MLIGDLDGRRTMWLFSDVFSNPIIRKNILSEHEMLSRCVGKPGQGDEGL